MKKKAIALLIAALWLLAACGGGSTLSSAGVDVNDDPESEAQNDAPSVDPPERRTATVQVGSEVFEVESTGCLHSSGFFQLSGIGRSDSNTAMVDINGSMTEDFDSDGTNDPSATVALDFEAGEPFGPIEAGPADLVAESLVFSSSEAGFTLFEWKLEQSDGSTTMSGSGEIEDYSGILIPFGERLPLTFTATC